MINRVSEEQQQQQVIATETGMYVDVAVDVSSIIDAKIIQQK